MRSATFAETAARFFDLRGRRPRELFDLADRHAHAIALEEHGRGDVRVVEEGVGAGEPAAGVLLDAQADAVVVDGDRASVVLAHGSEGIA